MRILFINKQAAHGGRFHVPLAIGLQRLGHDVTWLGGQMGGVELWPDELQGTLRYSLEELESHLDTDLVVLVEHVDPHVAGVIALLNAKRPDYVYLSGFDYRAGCGTYWGPRGLGLKPRVFLKREAHPNFPDIVPFSGDAVNPLFRVESLKKTASVCALLANNDGPAPGNRRGVVGVCSKFIGANAKLITSANRLSLNEYIKSLNSATVSVSAWGVGYLCYRDMEALAANTIAAVQRNPSGQYSDLRDSCIIYSDARDLTRQLHLVLSDKELQAKMLQHKRRDMLRYSPEAKARKFLALVGFALT